MSVHTFTLKSYTQLDIVHTWDELIFECRMSLFANGKRWLLRQDARCPNGFARAAKNPSSLQKVILNLNPFLGWEEKYELKSNRTLLSSSKSRIIHAAPVSPVNLQRFPFPIFHIDNLRSLA